jgi:hypothetical protein
MKPHMAPLEKDHLEGVSYGWDQRHFQFSNMTLLVISNMFICHQVLKYFSGGLATNQINKLEI